MEEVFIVQKRPANGVLNGFYYRVVDVRTGQAINQNFLQAAQAETHCQELNEQLHYPAQIEREERPRNCPEKRIASTPSPMSCKLMLRNYQK